MKSGRYNAIIVTKEKEYFSCKVHQAFVVYCTKIYMLAGRKNASIRQFLLRFSSVVFLINIISHLLLSLLSSLKQIHSLPFLQINGEITILTVVQCFISASVFISTLQPSTIKQKSTFKYKYNQQKKTINKKETIYNKT